MMNFRVSKPYFLIPFPAAILAAIAVCLPANGDEITSENLKVTEAKVRELARKALPCTVSLIPAPGGGARRMGTGSGVIVDEGGLILTAAHVSMEMGEKVTVIFPDGKRVSAKVLGMDYTRDSGMVQITDKGKYPFVELGESKSLERNDWTVALGHAGGYQHDRTPPIRLGRVIANNPEKFLTTDSALIGGDSGGPLFDIDGKLIGIHSNIGFSLSQNNHVPISTYKENWDRLESGERWGGNEEGGLIQNPDRPMMGAVLEDAGDDEGALVSEVLPRSPSEKAGLEVGDIVIKAGGTEIKDSDALIARIQEQKAGDKLDLLVKRKDKEKKISVELTASKKLRRPPGREPQRVPRPRSPREKRKLHEEFSEKLRESMEKGKLLLTEEDMKKFRGMLEFIEFMEKFKKDLSPEELEQLEKIAPTPNPAPAKVKKFDPDEPIPVSEEFFREVLDAFRPSVSRASDATHLVFRGREWRSLCTVVHEDGYVVTKASEIETKNNQPLMVMLAKDNRVAAEVVKTFPSHDLALLKLEDTEDLEPVYWDTAGETLPLGSFLSAAGTGPDPVAIGVVSVKSRTLSGKHKGFLGIQTAPDEKGVRVTGVIKGGGAQKAGVEPGDIITKIDDVVCDTPEKLIRHISGSEPGDDVIIHYLREEKEAAVKVTLGDREKVDMHRADPSSRMNRMGTGVSEKSTGFENIIQTDLPIEPQQCGGPVVDLNGNVIGINIARAGRIKTYTIPSADILELLEPEFERIAREKSGLSEKINRPKRPVQEGEKPLPPEEVQ